MNFCTDTMEIWIFLGKILRVFIIVIPILIFVFGAIDFGKAVVASKDDEIKKALKSLLFRILAGAVILFIPVTFPTSFRKLFTLFFFFFFFVFILDELLLALALPLFIV